MANSYIEYTSGLTATTYSVPFNVLSITDVNVKGYNGTTWSDLTVSSRDAVAKTITLSGAPSAFQKIRVWRNTGTTQLVDFQNGSRLSESDLDTAYQQGLFVAQEVSENASTGALAVGETGAQGATGAAGVDGVDGVDGTNAEPFQPVAVTGATPSLDVGSYNFFNQGTLTANTTVSFANVPTNAKWSYHGAPGGVADNSLTWATIDRLDNKILDVSANVAGVHGMAFKSDGTKMFLLDDATDTIYQYGLSTAWDVSTGTYDSVSLSVNGQDATPRGFYFRQDGTQLFILGMVNDNVFQYDLSTAWDITTASYTMNKSVAAQTGAGVDVHFSTNGLHMYVTDGGYTYYYQLGTAWTVNTASYTSTFNWSPTSQGAGRHVWWNSTGTKMFSGAENSYRYYEWSASTPWDLSTVTQVRYGDFTNNSNASENKNSMAFSSDGRYFYTVLSKI